MAVVGPTPAACCGCGNVPICSGGEPRYPFASQPVTCDHRGSELPERAREDSMRMLRQGALIAALGLPAMTALVAPATAEDLMVTQYRADPSGAPYGIALAKGFFAKAGVNITGIISGDGGGASVRSAMASELGYGDVSPAPAIAAIDQGQDIRIVNITSRSIADRVLIVMPLAAQDRQDLKGKFGISNPKSSAR
jgi:NitT/TauT family transport system substrate-binding protein